MKHFTVREVCEQTGLTKDKVYHLIEQEWILPSSQYAEEQNLDEEDLSRIHLILDLKSQLGVNDDAIPVILHLIDQLHYLRSELKIRLRQQN